MPHSCRDSTTTGGRIRCGYRYRWTMLWRIGYICREGRETRVGVGIICKLHVYWHPTTTPHMYFGYLIARDHGLNRTQSIRAITHRFALTVCLLLVRPPAVHLSNGLRSSLSAKLSFSISVLIRKRASSRLPHQHGSTKILRSRKPSILHDPIRPVDMMDQTNPQPIPSYKIALYENIEISISENNLPMNIYNAKYKCRSTRSR